MAIASMDASRARRCCRRSRPTSVDRTLHCHGLSHKSISLHGPGLRPACCLSPRNGSTFPRPATSVAGLFLRRRACLPEMNASPNKLAVFIMHHDQLVSAGLEAAFRMHAEFEVIVGDALPVSRL